MRFFLLVVFFIPITYLHSDETLFQLTLGSNIKNFPLKIYKTNEESLKQPFSINLNEWIVSPTFSSFNSNKFKSNLYEKKKYKEKLFIKFKMKF